MREARRGILAGRGRGGRAVRCRGQHRRSAIDSGGALDIFIVEQRSQKRKLRRVLLYRLGW
jgi:hypothetical protein